MLEENKKKSRLERKEAKELEWVMARMNEEYSMSKEYECNYQVDRLEEMMKCVTLMTDMEDASTNWRKWSSNRLSLSGVTPGQSIRSLSSQETGCFGQDENLLLKTQEWEDDRPIIHEVWQPIVEDMECEAGGIVDDFVGVNTADGSGGARLPGLPLLGVRTGG